MRTLEEITKINGKITSIIAKAYNADTAMSENDRFNNNYFKKHYKEYHVACNKGEGLMFIGKQAYTYMRHTSLFFPRTRQYFNSLKGGL